MEQTGFEKMLDALAQGDRSAFQQFYDQYGLPVYRYLLEKTGDTERTRRLWKDVFRTLMDRLRAEPRPDLPLLLLTTLADLQLESESGSETVETQAERLSNEWMDELSSSPQPTEQDEPEPPVPEAPPAENLSPDVDAHETAENTDWPDFTAIERETSETAAEYGDVPSPTMAEADEPEPEPKPKRGRAGWIILLIILILVVLIALWAGAGFAMTGGLLPYFDLGFSWFNRVFFPLFPLS